MLHNISRDDLVDLYKIMLRKTTAYGPEEDLERAFAENLRIMFDPPQSEDTVWSLPMHIPIVNWRYYDSCNVHCLNLHNTTAIYMLAERSYPLSEEVCRMMLKKKLFAQNNEVKKKLSTMSNRHKDWIVQEQTALVKMVFSRPWTCTFLVAKGLATPELMANSLLTSQPANDEFSQHLSDNEASNHKDASDTGAAPKQQQQMEHYLEYIDNDVWKVIQNGNSKKRISTGKDGVIRILPPVTVAEIQAVEKERKAKNILLMAIPKEHIRRFHGMDDAKEI
ncbi:hypothetical protein Tco_0825588 [Tanacetum coccineum]